jgi:inosine-uridine nucleoside N-ribohydrolase
MEKIKLLLDTDIGSFVDDTLCLAYLLTNPRCDLLGITTVCGETDKRAEYAQSLCRSVHKNVPVYSGMKTPLINEYSQSVKRQIKVIHSSNTNKNLPKKNAIDFLRETIRSHPREITLLGIGPLTNIAILFAIDEEIPHLLKGLVLMCGTFSHSSSHASSLEWNARLDPHATAIVYQHTVALHRTIGLDITTQVTMKTSDLEKYFQTSPMKTMFGYIKTWLHKKKNVTFHDPLAAATIFDHGICEFEKGNVDVELTSSHAAGMTYWTTQYKNGKHEIAVQVNQDRFFNRYFSAF